jgi:septum formation protein
MKKIILASSSPRRADLLRQIGVEFTVDPARGAEPSFSGGDPHEYARMLSLNKAKQAAACHPDALIIAADTFGMIDGRFIGKPHTAPEAVKMLAGLSERSHAVITGFTVFDTSSGKDITRSVETEVRFRKLTREEIEAYVATGEPLDKAGAYAIQGKGAVLVESIEGDYSNVVGLPLAALARALKEFGVDVLPEAP